MILLNIFILITDDEDVMFFIFVPVIVTTDNTLTSLSTRWRSRSVDRCLIWSRNRERNDAETRPVQHGSKGDITDTCPRRAGTSKARVSTETRSTETSRARSNAEGWTSRTKDIFTNIDLMNVSMTVIGDEEVDNEYFFQCNWGVNEYRLGTDWCNRVCVLLWESTSQFCVSSYRIAWKSSGISFRSFLFVKYRNQFVFPFEMTLMFSGLTFYDLKLPSEK